MVDRGWSAIQISGIAKIEKCVGEYNIWELKKSPYGKFKIKIYESAGGNFSGYSNLQVIDQTGSFCCAVGHGKTSAEALEDTMLEFLKMVDYKENWDEKDFICSDAFDF